jgi:protein gp37
MADTKIEWADKVWNTVTGCTKVSQGCKNCYANAVHDKRHKAFLQGKKVPQQYAVPFETILLHEDRLEAPLHWRKPQRIFVDSMSDLFHPDVPDKFIGRVWSRMLECPKHTFMILTKRPQRMVDVISRLVAECERKGLRQASNIWLGVSAEDQQTADERIPYLLQTPAAVRFVSCEPLLGPVDLLHHLAPVMHVNAEKDLSNDTANALVQMGRHVYKYLEGALLDWVIAGGESGPGARPMHPQWAKSIKDQCQAAGVPFFFKQWGEWVPRGMAQLLGFDAKVSKNTAFDAIPYPVIMSRIGKKAAGRLLDGREWSEFPPSN